LRDSWLKGKTGGQTMGNRNRRCLYIVENLWVARPWIICGLLGIGTGIAYFYNLITDIRCVISNTATFASIIVAIIGVFLTMVVELSQRTNAPIVQRTKQTSPNFFRRLTRYLRNQILVSILVVLFSLIYPVLPVCIDKQFLTIAVILWGFFFWMMTIGAVYSIILVTDIILRDSQIPTQQRRF
jgi:uncharacterized membrane protein